MEGFATNPAERPEKSIVNYRFWSSDGEKSELHAYLSRKIVCKVPGRSMCSTEDFVVNKRSEPALELKNSPLVLVLTQIRFSPVLRMDKCVPDIQELLRKKGLSRFSKEQTQQLIFGPEPAQSTYMRWVFSDRSKREAVVLTNDFFVYEVSQYSSFDDYLSRMLDLLEPINKAAELSFAEQIGIRYVDVLRGTSNLPVENMVCKSLRGLDAHSMGMKSCSYQFVIHGETDQGVLSIRSFDNKGKHFLPPDLQTEHLEFADGDTSRSDEANRVIDFDHIYRGEIDFNRECIEERMWALHDHTDRAFRNIVTNEAIESWKQGQS